MDRRRSNLAVALPGASVAEDGSLRQYLGVLWQESWPLGVPADL